MEPSYTKEELLKGMKAYLEDYFDNPDTFSNYSYQSVADATNIIDYLIVKTEEQRNV